MFTKRSDITEQPAWRFYLNLMCFQEALKKIKLSLHLEWRSHLICMICVSKVIYVLWFLHSVLIKSHPRTYIFKYIFTGMKSRAWPWSTPDMGCCCCVTSATLCSLSEPWFPISCVTGLALSVWLSP